MATTKKRINISLSDGAYAALVGLAKQDQVPEATKARALIEMALEIEEDRYFLAVAEARDVPGAKWISHKDAWK